MEGHRIIIIGIDDITRLFKDYVGMIGVPDDAMPIKLMLNPQEHRLGILMESDEWVGPQSSETIKFDINRVFTIN